MRHISLFVTCIVDQLYPDTGMAVVDILQHLGLQVDFPMAQTCCGQPAYNGGYRHEARRVARQFLRAFREAETIVTPSGSCAAMIRHEYPTLFADDQHWLPVAQHVASITWEFTEFIVDQLGVEDMGLKLPIPCRFAFHDSCHGLRQLGLYQAARTLLRHVDNATLVELDGHDRCCGFGGLFSVKMPEVSNAMLQRKLADIQACTADTIVTIDTSCMTQINGGLMRRGIDRRTRHIADVLAEGLP